MSIAPWEVRRSTLIKGEEETDPSHGCEPAKRPIESYLASGVIALDKPPGPTSSEIAHTVRRILKVRRASHGGTLERGEIPR